MPADIIRFAPQHQMPAYLFANGIEIGDHLSSLGRSTVVVPTTTTATGKVPRRGFLVRQLSPGPLSKMKYVKTSLISFMDEERPRSPT